MILVGHSTREAALTTSDLFSDQGRLGTIQRHSFLHLASGAEEWISTLIARGLRLYARLVIYDRSCAVYVSAILRSDYNISHLEAAAAAV